MVHTWKKEKKRLKNKSWGGPGRKATLVERATTAVRAIVGDPKRGFQKKEKFAKKNTRKQGRVRH